MCCRCSVRCLQGVFLKLGIVGDYAVCMWPEMCLGLSNKKVKFRCSRPLSSPVVFLRRPCCQRLLLKMCVFWDVCLFFLIFPFLFPKASRRVLPENNFYTCTCLLALVYLHLLTCSCILTLGYLLLYAYTWILVLVYLHLDTCTCELALVYLHLGTCTC